MTRQELDKVLANHRLWLIGLTTGKQADLRGVNLRGANLQEADLQKADLQEANLRGADLRGIDLSGANLRGANLREADLREADLQGADLWYTSGIYSFSFGRHLAVCFKYLNIVYVNIGCLSLPLTAWLKDYKQIGKDENYSKLEIELYGDCLKSLSKRFK